MTRKMRPCSPSTANWVISQNPVSIAYQPTEELKTHSRSHASPKNIYNCLPNGDLFDSQQFDHENQCGITRNSTPCTPFAVGQIVGNIELVLRTHRHQLHPFCPTPNDLIESKRNW